VASHPVLPTQQHSPVTPPLLGPVETGEETKSAASPPRSRIINHTLIWCNFLSRCRSFQASPSRSLEVRSGSPMFTNSCDCMRRYPWLILLLALVYKVIKKDRVCSYLSNLFVKLFHLPSTASFTSACPPFALLIKVWTKRPAHHFPTPVYHIPVSYSQNSYSVENREIFVTSSIVLNLDFF
jgi:hypothetical protein